MNTYKPAVCSHCNLGLVIDDSIDINQEVGYMHEFVVGHCPICRKEYSWTIKWERTKTFKLQEIES